MKVQLYDHKIRVRLTSKEVLLLAKDNEISVYFGYIQMKMIVCVSDTDRHQRIQMDCQKEDNRTIIVLSKTDFEVAMTASVFLMSDNNVSESPDHLPITVIVEQDLPIKRRG